MKHLLTVFFLLLACFGLSAQVSTNIQVTDLPSITINKDISLHIISPEPIRYVDISTHAIVGDLPVNNVLRLKVLPDSVNHLKDFIGNTSIVTIVGESFIAQYRLIYLPGATASSQVNILPEQTRPLDAGAISLTTPELKEHALSMLKNRASHRIRYSNDYGISVTLNHVYTVGDQIFLDITYRNETNLAYDIDEMRFKIEDKKINKATNVQSIEIKPVWQLYTRGGFKKIFRNIYVLKKVTFPENKLLNIELTEKQISGRTITLKLKYGDILRADTF